jgi:hypothetical protein
MLDPILVQRLEGAAWLAMAAFGYDASTWPWWLFFVLLLAPDLSMMGYLAGPRVGGIAYNLAHTFIGPAALIAWAWAGGPVAALALGSVWLAHVGMDHAFGYGLKLKDGFEHTHLGRIGRDKQPAHGS